MSKETDLKGLITMKKAFACSLCHQGILGGMLYIDNSSIIYRTNKLTIDKEYRNLVLPREEIQDISWKRVLFPLMIIHMKDGKKYTLLMYNKRRFNKHYNSSIQV